MACSNVVRRHVPHQPRQYSPSSIADLCPIFASDDEARHGECTAGHPTVPCLRQLPALALSAISEPSSPILVDGFVTRVGVGYGSRRLLEFRDASRWSRVGGVPVTPHDDAPNPPAPAGSRRSFLGVLLGVASATVGALLGIPVVRYLLYPLTSGSTASDWSDAGSLLEVTASPVPVSRTLHLKGRDGWQETESSPTVYLIRKGDTVQALSAICPHLGCTLPWDASRNAFVCPCHGGVFGPDGAHRSGPPRRGMDALQTKVTNGNVTVKYQTFRLDVPNKEVTS